MELSLEEERLIDSYVDELLGTPYTILQFLKSKEHAPLCPSVSRFQFKKIETLCAPEEGRVQREYPIMSRSSHIPLPTVRQQRRTLRAARFHESLALRTHQEKMLNLAVAAPFAPIRMLSAAQKRRMRIPDSPVTFDDIQAMSTSVSAAEFVLD